MENFLEETKLESNHTPNNIKFIGSQYSGYYCNWDEFYVLADKEYDDGYCSQQVVGDLIIVFNDDSYLFRKEYDDSVRWGFMKKSLLLKQHKFSCLFADDKTLAEMNEV